MKIEADFFPFVLDAPIVVVSRCFDGVQQYHKDGREQNHELAIERLVTEFGGVFAGT